MKVNEERATRIRRAVAVAAAFTWFAGCFSAANAQVVNYGTYIITSVHSGLAITDPGASNTNGADLEQQTVTNATSQQWTLTSVGANQYTLTNASSGQFLEVAGASGTSGALVDQYPANGNANQTWTFISLGGSHYELTNANSGQSLDVIGGSAGNGTGIDQWPYHGVTWEQWIFTPVAVPANEINYGCIGACLTDGEVEGYSGPPPTQGAAGTTTFQLTALASGNWNSAGIHTVGNYQIGHSTQLPDQQVSYFEFNFSSIQGRTVRAGFVLIPGSTDYDIGVVYPTRCNLTATGPCFKVGIRPVTGLGYSTAEIVNASSNHNSAEAAALIGNQNEDLGYGWVSDGLHLGTEFGAYTFNLPDLQDMVSAGGDQVFLGADDFDSGESNLSGGGACPACPGGFENYIWGSTGYNTGIIALITVDGGEASIPVVPNGIYEVKNLNSGAALEVASAKDGALLDQSTYTGDSKQLWKIARLADGNYTIASVSTGQQLDANQAAKPWVPARISPADKTANQEWAISPTTDGNYTIKSAKTGLLLDVASAKTLNGAGIILGTAQNGYAHQQWSFKPSNANQQASLATREVSHGSM
jgi:hypothetical protein